MPAVFWVNSTIPNRDGNGRIQFAFATTEAVTVEGFSQIIQSRGIICGERLSLKVDPDGQEGDRIIRDRQPMALAAGGIATVQLFTGRVLHVDRPAGRYPVNSMEVGQ